MSYLLLKTPIVSIFPPDKPLYEKHQNWTEETLRFKQEQENFRDYQYHSFIGWRSQEKVGTIINVDDHGNRVTVNESSLTPTMTYDFYGGSTIWGFGVSDSHTIPSQYSAQGKGIVARNFGEQAYNVRQNLNYFINNVVKEVTGDVVIFYDGVNDVLHQCRSVNGPFGDARTGFVREVLSQVNEEGEINIDAIKTRSYLPLVLQNTSVLMEKMFGRNGKKSIQLEITKEYINKCQHNEFASLVAESMVRGWELASLIAKANGVKFFAVLQPNPYTSQMPQPFYFEEFHAMIDQVYPAIISKAQQFDWFIDGSTWVENYADLYIDRCCHLNAKGNQLIALELLRVTQKGIGVN